MTRRRPEGAFGAADTIPRTGGPMTAHDEAVISEGPLPRRFAVECKACGTRVGGVSELEVGMWKFGHDTAASRHSGAELDAARAEIEKWKTTTARAVGSATSSPTDAVDQEESAASAAHRFACELITMRAQHALVLDRLNGELRRLREWRDQAIPLIKKLEQNNASRADRLADLLDDPDELHLYPEDPEPFAWESEAR